jgi:CRISPR-associated protein Cas2
MRILIAYDVATATAAGERRLRQVARACEDYGQRVQNSVFECDLTEKDWMALRLRLLEEILPREDSLRFYYLETDTTVEHHGAKRPLDLSGPLIV